MGKEDHNMKIIVNWSQLRDQLRATIKFRKSQRFILARPVGQGPRKDTKQNELLPNVELSLKWWLINALTAVGALMTLIDFILSNTRRFYSSMGNPLAVKGLIWTRCCLGKEGIKPRTLIFLPTILPTSIKWEKSYRQTTFVFKIQNLFK